ncbi:MAG: hypothetical protein M2R46_01520 [Verrucomicrobia subdivision 3 bacterium]|nr:hypothetical protein [Limisphaerales bacterium]
MRTVRIQGAFSSLPDRFASILRRQNWRGLVMPFLVPTTVHTSVVTNGGNVATVLAPWMCGCQLEQCGGGVNMRHVESDG